MGSFFVVVLGAGLAAGFINPFAQFLWQAGGGSEAGLAGGSLIPAVFFLASIGMGVGIVDWVVSQIDCCTSLSR